MKDDSSERMADSDQIRTWPRIGPGLPARKALMERGVWLACVAWIACAACKPSEGPSQTAPSEAPAREGHVHPLAAGSGAGPSALEASEPAAGPVTHPATVEVRLYFPNRAYVESGREDLPHWVSETRAFTGDASARAERAMQALASGPQSPEALAVLAPPLRVLRTSVEGSLALVDFSSSGLSGSSLQEQLVVGAIVRTLTTLAGIERVQFLVDGQRKETLMGHIDVREPLAAPTEP